MEFWGVEVKPGETVTCEPGEERYIRLSQAALGESKNKGVENVPIYVKFNDQKLVLGTLSAEKCAQISYDLVFEQEFELSHGSKNASVYFCGYKSFQEEDSDGEMFDFDESEEDEDVQIAPNVNGKPKAKAQGGKPAAVKFNVEKEAKTGGAIKAELKAEDDKSDDDEDDESSDDDEDMLAMGGSDDEDSDGEEDSDDVDEDDSESSEEEDEATPKKAVANGKKRPAESASKTPPVPEKKAKLVTPAGQKTGGDGKKNAHVATPHPAKQAAKTPANSEKVKQQTPKSSGSVTCKSCNKSFNSENALQSHSKAKHSATK